ncbi:putative E3 ubiquitin ligase SUD1 [Pseudolycoriella hygida]|uniref:E3 ubiquitin ligase SUD1 n=1 Tax=Pseudolycoriella hygida TaxID=35572 RepID=A0A9Q0NFY9_9DIPT|nr:putative E3 ubiquitin ligase SUD1 [Pseudolycoriella hygida]
MSSTTLFSTDGRDESTDRIGNQDSTELTLVPFDAATTTNEAVDETDETIIDDVTIDALNEKNVCRICWSDETTDELIKLLCKCQGTVGYVHADCLGQWERVRRSRKCEICKEVYLKQRDLTMVLRSFFQYCYAGKLFCKISNIAASLMIAYANIILGEVNIAYLTSPKNTSPNGSSVSYHAIILSAAILPYFVINFVAVDFAMSELIDSYQIIRDWWRNEG